MERKLVLEFSKMHGAGNDFLLFDNRFYYLTERELSDIAKKHCQRRVAIGSDGIIALSNPSENQNDFKMDYFNADGSRGEMCGNGARCLVKFAFDSGISKTEFAFETDIGVCYGSYDPKNEDMANVELPITTSLDLDYQLSKTDSAVSKAVHFVNVGVPHLVVPVEDLACSDVESLGRILRNDPSLEKGANVNFVQMNQQELSIAEVRTYERGVEAETLACGTGAIASALYMSTLSPKPAGVFTIKMPGGTLTVDLKNERPGYIKLTGPIEKVFRGTIEI